MIIKTILIFFVLLGSIYLGIYLQQDSGYVLILLHNWTIETSLWVILASVLLSIIAIYLIICAFTRLINLPSTYQKWRASRLAKLSQAKTRQGLIEFNEGHWKRAKRFLIEALPNSDTPLLNYLTAARAAQEMGESTLRDDYLRQAQQSMPEATIAVELTQAQLQSANQQWEQALATLKHLQDISPKHPYVLKLLVQLYEEIKDWAQLINLLPLIKRQQILSKHTFAETEQRVYYQELKNLIKYDKHDLIEDLIQKLPNDLHHNQEITIEYTKYLLSQGNSKKVENILRKFLQNQINDKILELYSQISHDDLNLNFIKSLKSNNSSWALYLCLGKISASKELWGKALSYFEDSIKLNPTTDAYENLGDLYKKLDNLEAACDAYKKGLRICFAP